MPFFAKGIFPEDPEYAAGQAVALQTPPRDDRETENALPPNGPSASDHPGSVEGIPA